LSSVAALRLRRYGSDGPRVIVLHGGPAAAGEAGPLARGLAQGFRVLEPWQRGSGGAPLTVARHVADLHELVCAPGAGARPALVGESWGAMLALAYAAAHPDAAGPLALVGCGSFDGRARARLEATLAERLDAALLERLERLEAEVADPAEQLRRRFELMAPLYRFEPVAEPADPQRPPFDLRAHTETWDDMLRLQAEGVYPAAFRAIRSPVLMIHGDYDPHPGTLIRASLEPFLPQLEYHELPRCGHQPWLEPGMRAAFFRLLRDWLRRHLPEG
jgi:pimeloyl-ACP methyl ester carboxylesterase